jgi:hypothetical protein
MSGRHGRSSPDGQDDPQAAVEEEAIHIARVIRGVSLRLLQRPEILEQPKLVSALRDLDEEVVGQLAYGNNNAGRHRSTVDRAIGQQISEAAEDDLKPNPLTAATPAEFMEVLRQYRAWSGEPPWRTMAERAGQIVVFSTMYTAMNGNTLPKLHVVKAIIIGCGGGENDLNSFANAWRRIRVGQVRDRSWLSRSSYE